MSGEHGRNTRRAWNLARFLWFLHRSPRQAQLRLFLTGCAVVPLGEQDAHEAGRLLAVARTTDVVVDAAVVTVALRHHAVIVTGDPDDMERLVRASDRKKVDVAVWSL